MIGRGGRFLQCARGISAGAYGLIGPCGGSIRYDSAVGARNLSDLGELERLGVDTAAPDAADTVKLVKYLWEQGADRDELREAVRTGTLGPLGLELALRAPGDARKWDGLCSELT